MGASGAHPQNAQRDLLRQLGKMTPAGVPPLYEASVPMWDARGNCQTTGNLYFALPHEHLQAAVGRTSLAEWTQFSEELRPRQRQLAEWCGRVGIENSGNDVIPLGLWGDGAPYHTRDSVNLLLFNALVGKHTERKWITAFPKKALASAGALASLGS